LGFLAADLSDENRTSPNKLTAALTDSKGALVSISPISPLSASAGGGRDFVPIFAFISILCANCNRKKIKLKDGRKVTGVNKINNERDKWD
jgi:hypothetical protein